MNERPAVLRFITPSYEPPWDRRWIPLDGDLSHSTPGPTDGWAPLKSDEPHYVLSHDSLMRDAHVRATTESGQSTYSSVEHGESLELESPVIGDPTPLPRHLTIVNTGERCYVSRYRTHIADEGDTGVMGEERVLAPNSVMEVRLLFPGQEGILIRRERD